MLGNILSCLCRAAVPQLCEAAPVIGAWACVPLVIIILFEGVCETHVILIPGACGTGGLNCSSWTVSPGPAESGCKFQRVNFCAQARYLRALGLRRGLRCPEDVSMETQVSQSVPQDCPRCSKEATKVPKRETKGAQCGPQSMPWHSKVRSKESYIHQNSRSTAPAATMLVISYLLRYY